MTDEIVQSNSELLRQEIADLQSRKRQAEQAEAERLRKEQANQNAIAAANQRLADLELSEAKARFNESLIALHKNRDNNVQAIETVLQELDPIATELLDKLRGKMQSVDDSFVAHDALLDEAIAAMSDLFVKTAYRDKSQPTGTQADFKEAAFNQLTQERQLIAALDRNAALQVWIARTNDPVQMQLRKSVAMALTGHDLFPSNGDMNIALEDATVRLQAKIKHTYRSKSPAKGKTRSLSQMTADKPKPSLE